MPINRILTGNRPRKRMLRKRPSAKLHNTTVRDFGGGLNVVDSEQNLTSRFAPIFDNMVTYTDRRVGPRYGYEMWLKTKVGEESSGTATVTANMSVDSRWVTLNWPSHPFGLSFLHHLTITDAGTGLGAAGIPNEDFIGTFGVIVIDANNIKISVATAATSNGSTVSPPTISWTKDTHMCGGRPVECTYFSNYVVVWTSAGEIFRIDVNRTVSRIWDAAIANAQAGSPVPWGQTQIVAFDVFGKRLICSNGTDKSLDIDFARTPNMVMYQQDGGSDEFIPPFDACKSAFRYWNIHDTTPVDERNVELRIADKDTSVVFSDAPVAPGDAVDINISKITASVDLTIRAFATIKDSLLVIMPNATVMMKLGIYDTQDPPGHDPQPIDTLQNFGTSAMRSVVEIGSDVFMIDYNGVPSARLSAMSNAVVPVRVSQYIETMMSRHIGRLKKDTIRYRAFGLYDTKNKLIHFYLPKFDNIPDENALDIRQLDDNPLFYDDDMAGKAQMMLHLRAHQFEVGDDIIIANATDVGAVDAVHINGTRKVLGLIDDDYILISIGIPIPVSAMAEGGGNFITVTPIDNESIGYIYHFVPALKMQAWARYKTKNIRFQCGCCTIQGRTFLFNEEGIMFRYGSDDAPVYGDWLNMYDHIIYNNGQTYNPGERIYDDYDGIVYQCIETTSSDEEEFRDAREEDPDAWIEYEGEPIDWAWELPWADFGARQSSKALRFVHVDAVGKAPFTMKLFNDNLYKDEATGLLIPARTLQFVPNNVGGFGAGTQTYGGGRRTREQRLWQMPIHFKLIKTRLEGSTTKPLTITGLSFLYQRGSPVRG